jgi:hypothetical protein
MHALLRRLSSTFAVLLVVIALAVPALADDYSGTFRIVTATGKHMIVTLIQSGDSITGYYVGNGVAGRITGHMNGDTSAVYTWEERAGDSSNDGTHSGWGNMSFNNSGSQMKTAWGYAGQQRAVGFWNATLINP